jgi:hypothetical protein
MKKISLLFLVLIILILQIPLWANTPQFPNQTIQLAWFYKPPKNGNLDPLVKNFHVYILTKTDEEIRDKLKKRGVSTPFLQYLRFDAIEDPGSCSARPYRNQVADRKGDFCRISKNHPDWFLLNDRGKRILADRHYLMDPGNDGWREFFLKRAKESQEKLGWDGVFLDNVEGGLVKRYRNNGVPRRYPTAESYRREISQFLKYLHESYFQPSGRPLWGNIIALDEPKVWFRYLKHLDGAMMESFAVGWNDDYRSKEEWEEHLSRAERTQKEGKRVILVAQGEKDKIERQQFAFGSYLLIASGKASFRYTKANQYVHSWFYKNYRLKLGEPLGERYFKRGAWRRDFTNGRVIVHPRKRRAEITIG